MFEYYYDKIAKAEETFQFHQRELALLEEEAGMGLHPSVFHARNLHLWHENMSTRQKLDLRYLPGRVSDWIATETNWGGLNL